MVQKTMAQTATPLPQQTTAYVPVPATWINDCPVSLDMNNEEQGAYVGFNSALSHLNDYYGTPQFELRLNEIIANQWPYQKVIEVSPVFMEKVLNLIDQHYIKNDIAATIGLDHPQWNDFSRTMMKVTFATYTTENKYGAFTKRTAELMKSIQNLNARTMKTKGLTRELQQAYKARAITRLGNMVLFLERWSNLNKIISQERAVAAGKQLSFNMVSVAAGGLMIASMVYAAPLVLGAGAFGASLTTDIVVAANLARLGQIAAGAGMGFTGAPVGLLLTDATMSVIEAQRLAANNHSVYACELDKQFVEFRKRGAAPYMKAALIGGSIGALGGALTLTAAGAKTVLWATTFGVGVAQAYSIGKLTDESMKSLAEYRLAIQFQEADDNEQARIHLQNSRYHAQRAGFHALEGIVVGALSYAIATNFREALIKGEASIRVLFANSSDTLPMAVGVLHQSVNAIMPR